MRAATSRSWLTVPAALSSAPLRTVCTLSSTTAAGFTSPFVFCLTLTPRRFRLCQVQSTQLVSGSDERRHVDRLAVKQRCTLLALQGEDLSNKILAAGLQTIFHGVSSV
jgi:hypothetical protein